MGDAILRFWFVAVGLLCAIVIALVVLFMQVHALKDLAYEIRDNVRSNVSRDAFNGWVDRSEDRLRATLGRYEILLPRLPAREN